MNVAIDLKVCGKCPMSKVEAAEPIFGEIEGRPVLIVAQSPTHEENDAQEMLVNTSPQGKFVWEALQQVGIEREQCDVAAAIRCLPSDPVIGSYSTMLRPRAPKKEEIAQCKHYTKALVHIAVNGEDGEQGGQLTRAILILGQVAAKQLLGAEYKKNKRIIDSARLGARVFLVDHPGFFLRNGIRGLNEDDERLKAFRQTVQALAEFIGSGASAQSAEDFLREQNYVSVTTAKRAWYWAKALKQYALDKGERLSVDVEDDVPDDVAETGDEAGADIMLSVAVCPKPGHSIKFLVDHPEHIPEERDEIVAALTWLLSDPEILLTMHYGSTDAEKLRDLLGIETTHYKNGALVGGYDLDTFTGMYIANPGRNSYGMDKLPDEFAPQFAGYKYIIAPYVGPQDVAVPKGVAKRNETLYNYYKNKALLRCEHCQVRQFASPDTAKKKGGQYVCQNKDCGEVITSPPEMSMHFGQIPVDVLRLYNNADADLGKRFEIEVRDKVPLSLARIYTDMGHLVMRMERNGPLVDYRQIDTLKKVWPPQVKKAADRLRELAGDGPKGDGRFNPNKPEDIAWLLWEHLDLPYPDPKAKKKNSQKETLLQVAPDYPLAGEVIAYRKLAKTESTYINGYEYCANYNGGKLRTKWWLTGTRTGRMSSGGSKEKIKGVVNLQNIQKNVHIRNILVSDHRWRELHLFIKAMLATHCSNEELEAAALEKFGDMEVFLEFDQGQVEVRVAAQLSGDKMMIADCEAGDIHSRVGHAMTGWAIEKIKHDKDTRTRTKNVHFGILFGLKPDGILRYIKAFDPTTKITVAEVAGYYDAYFTRYPGMQVFIEKQHIFAERNGYVATLFGMKRPIIVNESTKDLFDDYGQPAYWKNIAVNCYDRETEVLTKNRGWINGFDLEVGDVLLTKNVETGKAEWHPAEEVKKFPDYTGPMIEFNSNSFSAMTTPAHEWLVDQHHSKQGRQKNLIRTSTQIKPNHGYKIHRTAEWDGAATETYSTDFVRLCGWFLTDGCGTKPGKKKASTRASVFQTKSKHVVRIDALFTRLGIETTRREKDGNVVWWLRGEDGRTLNTMFPERTLTMEFLDVLTREQIRVLLKTMLAGDGHRAPHKGKSRGKITFACSTQKKADMFQTLCALAGGACSVKYRDMRKYRGRSVFKKTGQIPRVNGHWLCTLQRRKFADVLPGHRIEHAESKGGVWCPVVKNHTLMVRRSGQQYLSRNTPVQGTAHQLLMCGMVALIRQPKKYGLLGVPQMEVHDNLVMRVKLRHLIRCYWLMKELLEQEPLRTVEREFPDIHWKVKLEVDGAAGFRFGTKSGLDNDNMTGSGALGGFLRNWYAENVKSIDALKKLKADLLA